MPQDGIYVKAVQKYGEEAQCRLAMEECAELIQAINKSLRYPTPTARKRMIEEMADVTIMMRQLQIIFSVSDDELRESIDAKTERLDKRMKD